LRCVHAVFLYIAVVSARAEDSWFGERLFTAFAEDLRTPAYTSPAPDASPSQRRIPPAPFDSPPFQPAIGKSAARRSLAILVT